MSERNDGSEESTNGEAGERSGDPTNHEEGALTGEDAVNAPVKENEKILEQQVDEGTDALERGTFGLLISGLSAGLDVGFSLFAIAIFAFVYGWAPGDPAFRLAMAGLYSIGYVFVILGGSELFTEHTTLAVLPVFDGEATWAQLARLWGLVYTGNLVGATAFGSMFGFVGPELGFTDATTLSHIGHELVSPAPWGIVASGVLAGWLMGLVSWLVTASRDTVSQIILIVMVTGVIGLGPLHHCVVGAAELTAAFVVGGIGVTDGLVTLACATVGNAIGGVLFVALLKYSLIVRSRYTPDETF